MPNPARDGATVLCTLPRPMPLRVSVFDVQGREVAKLADGPSRSGMNQARLAPLAPGLYFVALRAEGARLERKLVVLR